MFVQFKKLNNESGMVLFIVLMTAIIIMIFSVGILTQSLNEINYAQQQIDQISSDQLTKGIFWNSYASGMSSVTGATVNFNATNRLYQVTISNDPLNPGRYKVVSNYDSFN